MEKKNIAIVITKLNGGGAERVASNLSIELSGHYNVTLILFDGRNQTYPHGGTLVDLALPAQTSLWGKLSSVRIYLSDIGGSIFKKYISTRWIASRSDKVVAVTRAVMDDLVRNFKIEPGKTATIYNSCDGDRLLALAAGNGIKHRPDAALSVVTMGVSNRQKGQWHLIRAFKRVLEAVPEAVLYVLGEGEKLNHPTA